MIQFLLFYFGIIVTQGDRTSIQKKCNKSSYLPSFLNKKNNMILSDIGDKKL